MDGATSKSEIANESEKASEFVGLVGCLPTYSHPIPCGDGARTSIIPTTSVINAGKANPSKCAELTKRTHREWL